MSVLDFECDVISPSDLMPQDKDGWHKLCEAHRAYQTPLLQPCFSIVVADRRKDARIALYRREGRIIGVLPFHLRPNRFARPMGAPFSDFAGPVLAQNSGLTPPLMLQLAGLRTYRFSGLPDPWGVFSDLGLRSDEAYQMDLAGTDPDAYLESRRAAHSKRFKNFRRQIHQLERSGVKLEISGGPAEDADYQLLTSWKSAQFRRTGRIDLTEKPLTAALLRSAKDYASDDAQGYMVRLTGNGDLIAAHFGLRSNTHFHPWLAAYRPEYSHSSPGSMLLYKAISAMPEMELQVYELAGGHEYYKKYFASSQQATLSGELRLTPSGEVRTPELAPQILEDNSRKARLLRRMDHIAVCETRPLMRVTELVSAITTAPLSRSAPHEQ